ncbi:hypothetical protein ACF1B0_35935 [Streptomyces anandii]|uniref:hypothetical protein n=1 Tax=Streptomyces anandii TaxID=285454 RepID=UPI0036F5D5FD
MGDLADLNRAASLRTETELAESIQRVPPGERQMITPSVQPQISITGDSPAEVFQAAADWARENPDFYIISALWFDDPRGRPQYGIRLLVDNV